MRRSVVRATVPLDRKAFLSDPALLSALGAHIRSRVPQADADDVLQSVLADALAADGAPDNEGAMRRWVYGVARNKVADFYRRSKREQPTDLVDERPAPSSGRAAADDLLRWAEHELPKGSDAQQTLEWMLREGEGEKLDAIAASEKLPAPRVRKRVSRMREHFRARWAAYVAALAAAGLAVVLVFYILRRKPVPEARIVPEPPSSVAPHLEPLEIGRRDRARALEECDRADWKSCLDGLDRAALLDPAGDADERVVRARAAASAALTPPPSPPPPLAPSESAAPPRSIPTTVPTPTSRPRPRADSPPGFDPYNYNYSDDGRKLWK